MYISEDSDGTGGELRRFYFGLFPRLPTNIDAVTLAPSDRCARCIDLYFIKGTHYINDGSQRYLIGLKLVFWLKFWEFEERKVKRIIVQERDLTHMKSD